MPSRVRCWTRLNIALAVDASFLSGRSCFLSVAEDNLGLGAQVSVDEKTSTLVKPALL